VTEKQESLESFAKRIETRIKAGLKGTDSMERLLCRLMTSKDMKVAALLGSKWVEWRYGKATQPLSGQNGQPIHVLVEHIGTQDKAPAKAD
jgi:hypothetical protein